MTGRLAARASFAERAPRPEEREKHKDADGAQAMRAAMESRERRVDWAQIRARLSSGVRQEWRPQGGLIATSRDVRRDRRSPGSLAHENRVPRRPPEPPHRPLSPTPSFRIPLSRVWRPDPALSCLAPCADLPGPSPLSCMAPGSRSLVHGALRGLARPFTSFVHGAWIPLSRARRLARTRSACHRSLRAGRSPRRRSCRRAAPVSHPSPAPARRSAPPLHSTRWNHPSSVM